MKLRKNYFKILCSVFFCFALGTVGCSNGDSALSSGDTSSNTSLAPDEFVVTFDTKGGTSVAQQVIKAGNKVTKPQDPTQEYYSFTGWYWDFEEVTPFDFEGVTIASNTTIYAGWTPDHSASGLDNEPAGGGGGGGGGSKNYVATAVPNWVQDYGAAVFAWAWPQGSEGSWYTVTLNTEGTSTLTASFTTSQDMQGFLLVRCVTGTTTPDWNIKSGDALGRIYNQTANMDCSSGVYSYTCAAWENYPKS